MQAALIFAAMALMPVSTYAEDYSKQFSAELQKKMEVHNGRLRQTRNPPIEVQRPYVEYEKAGYLIFSDQTLFDSIAAKRTMAENLPDHMKLIVYTDRPNIFNIASIRNEYERYVGDRLIILKTQSGGFWARDGVPIPVIDSEGDLAVVDARYYRGFESDSVFADKFAAQMPKHDYYFEGGNFIADLNGRCLTVNNSRVEKIPDSIFYDYYGCQSIHRLRHLSGIGHIDEVIKIIDDEHAITDKREYVAELESLGYEVTMIAEASNPYETYVNSVVLGNKIMMPSFSRAADDAAKQVYEGFGYEVYKVDSYRLSNYGTGSLHCITMTYPPTPVHKLVKRLSASILFDGTKK
ncbi:agmatine deiminase family protein [Oligoflexaceae bacterium]|nr:agmatine deiminase family protein [Oligoflexaceae bacterium]